MLTQSLMTACMMYTPHIVFCIVCLAFTPLVFAMRYTETMVQKNDTECKKLLQGIARCSPFICQMFNKKGGKDLPHGFLLSKSLKYLAHVSYHGGGENNTMKVRVWCTESRKATIDRLAEDVNDDSEKGEGAGENKQVGDRRTRKVYEYVLGPCLLWTEYVKTPKLFTEGMLRPPIEGSDQHRIVDKMVHMYRNSANSNVAVLVYGPPGTGKSMLAYVLASDLNGSVCKFNPTEPGASIVELYNTVDPKPECPLVLLVDEYDEMLYAVHDRRVVTNSKVRTLVKDKPSHNSHCDDLRTYPNLFVIRTMNTPRCVVTSKTDPSYTRRGRNDAYFVCKTPVTPVGEYYEDSE